MANELDELTGPVNDEGRDVRVIEKQIPIKVGWGSTFFQIMLFVLGIIPGIIFIGLKIRAGKYLSQLQQKLQHDASQIDNYLEQRVQILSNAAALLEQGLDLDKSVFTQVAQARSGNNLNAAAQGIENINNKINLALERYPELKAHQEVRDCMQQNAYLQKEITAAREVYNDTVAQWNKDVYRWPSYQIVAAKRGYTTRIPFSIDKETREKARSVFF